MAVKPKRSVHLYVFLAVVGVIYLIVSLAIMGGLVPKALRAADDMSVACGIIMSVAWAVVSFYMGREVFRILATKPKGKR